tara:strand:- start:3008 stop:3649 length:642 start_codon:yes stop_codon:yes gene_type:complete
VIRIKLGKLKRKLKANKTLKDKAFIALYSIKFEDGDIAIDCGANVGNVSQYLCNSGATVYAFEPNPHAYDILEKKLSKYKNAHCYNKAVNDHNSVSKLYLHVNSNSDEVMWSTGSSLLQYKKNVNNNKYIETEVIDLIKFIENLQKPIKLLKLDVEGVEHIILKKLINNNLHKQIEHIFVETHEDQADELLSETKHLQQLIASLNITNINLNW